MGTQVRIQPGDCPSLDRLSVEALVIYFYAERVQPRSVPGMVDWRLSGRLARLLKSGRFGGLPGEALLMPSQGRIGAARVFLYGLGMPKARVDDGLKVLFAPTLDSLRGAGVERLAVSIAPPHAGLFSAPEVLARWLSAVGSMEQPFTEVVLLEAQGELSQAKARLEGAATEAGLSLAP